MAEVIKLPDPQKEFDFPLMKAIEHRRSKRKWKDDQLCDQEISNILWAACGITKESTKRTKSKRTAPSACNSQSIKIYVALKNGFFLFDEVNHTLIKLGSTDIRKDIASQKMMHSAPLGLIYVSDYEKMSNFLFRNDEIKWFFAGTDAAYISQNVYLYCAAANLNTVVLALVKREKLQEVMGLKSHEKVVFTQVVGKALD